MFKDNMKHLLPLIIIFCFIFSCTSSKEAWIKQETSAFSDEIDNFKLDGIKISVKFFDPLKNIDKKYPLYSKTESESEKLAIWKKYIAEFPVFLFTAVEKGSALKSFCLKGSSDTTTNSNMVLEAVNAGTFDLNDPVTIEYKNQILNTYKLNLPAGFLFENMDMFKLIENKQYIIEGLLFHDDFFNVVKYKDIKQAVSAIILKDLRK